MAQQTRYRIPPTAPLNLGVNQALPLQVNFCKKPQCDNFGIAAKEEPITPGPGPIRDFHYKVNTASKGRIPAILCKSCKVKIPIKSNTGISAEFERITCSILTTTEKLACKTANCPNLGYSVGAHPERYSKTGFHSTTGKQFYLCKACKKRLLASDPVRIHQKTRHLTSDLFSRVANMSPVRYAVRGLSIKSTDTYYSILDFISRRCDLPSGKFDRRMIDGDALKPEAFRQYAQYWLSCDEFLRGRKLGQRLGFTKSQDVLQQTADIYASAQSHRQIDLLVRCFLQCDDTL